MTPTRDDRRCLACGHRPDEPLPVGRVLLLARERLGLSGPAVLDAAGLPWELSRYYRLERVGKRPPDRADLLAICAALKIDPDQAAAGRLVEVAPP